MSQNRHLLIHKTEWTRMKKGLQDCECPITEKEDYIKSLNEQSQKWIKDWPDTVQGHVSIVEKHNKAEKLKHLELVKKYISKNNLKSNEECIKKARQLIFEDSSYGRQLLSALLESKALEERDEQIKFQNKIKHQAEILRQNEPKATSLLNANEMEINEIKIKEYQKQNAFEIAHANRAMFDKQKRDKKLEKERAKQEKNDDDAMNKFIEEEKKIMIEELTLHKESVKEYENINKKIKELKALKEMEDEKIRTVWRKYQDRVNYKEKMIFDEMHRNKANRQHYRKVYENIKHLNEERDKKYNDFVNKGIELSENGLNPHEEEANNIVLQRKVRKLLDEENKVLANLHKAFPENKQKCECHRQAFIGKKACKTKQNNDTNGLLFLKSKNTLLENLRQREKASSKNPLQNTHAYFAKHAAETLRECRYKNMALKVLHNYRRDNHLNAQTLPVGIF